MSMDKRVEAAATAPLQEPHYEDFEPLCYWRREDRHDTLVVHLSVFKKEELKIQISNTGILKITGERQVDATKRSRFLKEIKVTKDYNANNIHAKFAQGRLHVTFPKKISSSSSHKSSSAQQFPTNNQNNQKQEISKNDQVPDQNNSANTSEKANGDGKHEAPTEKGKVESSTRANKEEPAVAAAGRVQVVRWKGLGKVAVSIGVAMAAAFGVYVMYKYWAMYSNVNEEYAM